MDETKSWTPNYDYEKCLKIKRSYNITLVFVGFSYFIKKYQGSWNLQIVHLLGSQIHPLDFQSVCENCTLKSVERVKNTTQIWNCSGTNNEVMCKAKCVMNQ